MAVHNQLSRFWTLLVAFYCFLHVLILTVAIDPSTTTGCFIHTAMRHRAEKDGCRPFEFTVRGCWGRCDTNEVPQLGPPFVKPKHQVCTFVAYDTVSVDLPDCDPEVDPTYTYLKATGCGCRAMSSTNTEYSFRPDFYSTSDQ